MIAFDTDHVNGGDFYQFVVSCGLKDQKTIGVVYRLKNYFQSFVQQCTARSAKQVRAAKEDVVSRTGVSRPCTVSSTMMNSS